LAQAHLALAGSTAAEILGVLFAPDREIHVAVLDVSAAGRIGRIGSRFGLSLDVAHAIDTAARTRCFIVTAEPDQVAPTGLEVLDIGPGWD
jgi:hypothetical protein